MISPTVVIFVSKTFRKNRTEVIVVKHIAGVAHLAER